LPHFAVLEPMRSAGIRFPALHAGQRTISVVGWSMASLIALAGLALT
jgi:hypothetical protein